MAFTKFGSNTFNEGKCTSRVEINDVKCSSQAAESVSSSEEDFHVIQIKILPEDQQLQNILQCSKYQVLAHGNTFSKPRQSESREILKKSNITIISLKLNSIESPVSLSDDSFLHSNQIFHKLGEDVHKNVPVNTYIISLNNTNDMVQKSGNLDIDNSACLYYVMSNGEYSSSDISDSGACSNLGNNTINTTNLNSSHLLSIKANSKSNMQYETTNVTSEDQGSCSDNNHQNVKHIRTGSSPNGNNSDLSSNCELLNSSEINRGINTIPSCTLHLNSKYSDAKLKLSLFPESLLRDIRDRKFIINKDFKENSLLYSNLYENELITKLNLNISNNFNPNRNCEIREKNTSHIVITKDENEKTSSILDADKFYRFHLNEKSTDNLVQSESKIIQDESFAGYKDIHSDTSTIRSSKGTVRGVKNRVRNGIATFLQLQQSNLKNYREKDVGKVVLYTTSMGIVRETYAKCSNVKQILRTLLVKFEERDVFMSREYQQEIKGRMKTDEINVPQLFVEGQYIGDAEMVERLNESGDLRQMLKPYKSITASLTCQICGGYRLLPCPSCNGSKRSIHRNHFTAEFVALKCMNCDEVGLVKCHSC